MQIDQISRFHRSGLVDQVLGPRLRRIAGMLQPSDLVREVSARNDIDISVAVDIQGCIGKILMIVGIDACDFADFVGLPIRSRVPRIPGKHIELPVLVEVRHADGFVGRKRIDRVLSPAHCGLLRKARPLAEHWHNSTQEHQYRRKTSSDFVFHSLFTRIIRWTYFKFLFVDPPRAS